MSLAIIPLIIFAIIIQLLCESNALLSSVKNKSTRKSIHKIIIADKIHGKCNKVNVGVFPPFLSQLQMDFSGNSDEQITTKWYNPKYSEVDIDTWWKQVDKALLTIGSKGISLSHANSLKELISFHDKVRVRLANDKMDANAISAALLGSDVFGNTADAIELLHIRKREIMFGKLRNPILTN